VTVKGQTRERDHNKLRANKSKTDERLWAWTEFCRRAVGHENNRVKLCYRIVSYCNGVRTSLSHSGCCVVYGLHVKMAAVAGSVKVCETLGCGNDARLQCPTCIKLGIQGSYFCSQVWMCNICIKLH